MNITSSVKVTQHNIQNAHYMIDKTYEIIVDSSTEIAYHQFVQVVWNGLGFQSLALLKLLPPAHITEKGNENAVGQIRVVPGAWLPAIHEQITSVEPNKQILYRVIKGAFPAKFHSGQVDFEEIGEGKTRVSWSAKIEPFPFCYWIIVALLW